MKCFEQFSSCIRSHPLLPVLTVSLTSKGPNSIPIRPVSILRRIKTGKFHCVLVLAEGSAAFLPCLLLNVVSVSVRVRPSNRWCPLTSCISWSNFEPVCLMLADETVPWLSPAAPALSSHAPVVTKDDPKESTKYLASSNPSYPPAPGIIRLPKDAAELLASLQVSLQCCIQMLSAIHLFDGSHLVIEDLPVTGKVSLAGTKTGHRCCSRVVVRFGVGFIACGDVGTAAASPERKACPVRYHTANAAGSTPRMNASAGF